MESDGRLVVAGVDTHKREHALCLLDGLGRKVFEGFFSADERGYRELADAIGDPAECLVVGVECTMSYGAGLTRLLASSGFNVVEVLHPERRRRRRGSNKNDLEDAELAARAAIAGRHTSAPKAGDGWVEATRTLMVSRRLAVKTSTAAANAAHALIVSAPAHIRERYEGMRTEAMMRTLARREPGGDIVEEGLRASLRQIASMWLESRRQADAALELIGRIVEENAPALTAMEGCGALTAASLAIAAGDNPGRMGGRDSFAALCGTSPVEASSGDVRRHRLNRGGNRQANCALHQIVLSRMRHDGRTRAYVERRTAEGKSKREIIRCLKRYVANEAYRALLNPMKVPERQGPKIREMRRLLGLSQREVASMLLVSRTKVSEIECGKRRLPKMEQAYRDALERLAIERGWPIEAFREESKMALDGS